MGLFETPKNIMQSLRNTRSGRALARAAARGQQDPANVKTVTADAKVAEQQQQQQQTETPDTPLNGRVTVSQTTLFEAASVVEEEQGSGPEGPHLQQQPLPQEAQPELQHANEHQQEQPQFHLTLEYLHKGFSGLLNEFNIYRERSKSDIKGHRSQINVLWGIINELSETNRIQNCRINELAEKVNKYEREEEEIRLHKQQHPKSVPAQVQNTAKGKGMASKKTSSKVPECAKVPAIGAPSSCSSVQDSPKASTSGVPSSRGDTGVSSHSEELAAALAATSANGAPNLSRGAPPTSHVPSLSDLPTLTGALKRESLFIGNLGPEEGLEKLEEVIHRHTNIPKADIKLRELRKSSSGSRAYQVTVPEGGANKIREKRMAMFSPNSSITVETWGTNKARSSNQNPFRRQQQHRGYGGRSGYHNGPRGHRRY